jgi:hypothetical protein
MRIAAKCCLTVGRDDLSANRSMYAATMTG